MTTFRFTLKNTAKSNGEKSINILFIKDRKNTSLSLRHSCTDQQWSAETERVKKNHPDYEKLNKFIDLYLFDFLPKFDIPVFYTYSGLLIATFGMVISVISLANLNENLTVFPTSKENAELIIKGLYQFSRHLIYTGILLFVFGFAIFWESYYKLLISVLLLILFYLKTLYEENQLNKT